MRLPWYRCRSSPMSASTVLPAVSGYKFCITAPPLDRFTTLRLGTMGFGFPGGDGASSSTSTTIAACVTTGSTCDEYPGTVYRLQYDRRGEVNPNNGSGHGPPVR